MTPNIQLSPEFALNTSNWGFQPTNYTATTVTGLCYFVATFDMAPVSPKSLSSGKAISALVAERSRDSRKAAAYARARQRLANRLSQSEEGREFVSLASLRLSKGMSQTQLAELMDTHQPAIARLERGESDVKLSTLRQLAKALQVPLDSVFSAVSAQTQDK